MQTPSFKIALACCLVLLTACGPQVSSNRTPAEDHKLKVYYLWSTAGDPNQHSAIETGVTKALRDDAVNRMFGERVEFVSWPESGGSDEAMALAHELRRKPDTLAIIGPTFSGSTWSALPVYGDAGIPVMVTTASSPYLFFKHGEHESPSLDLDIGDDEHPHISFVKPGTKQPPDRYKNAFRLIPSDIPDQVSAIQLTIRKLNDDEKLPRDHPPHVMLICDLTIHSGASVYSKPMCDYLERVNVHRDNPGRETKTRDYMVVSSRGIDLDHGDLWGLVTEIHAVHPDYIVLVGYAELARDVLQGLAERHFASQSRPYTFIMTDGAFSLLQRLRPLANPTEKVTAPSAKVYLTASTRPHQPHDCDSSEEIQKTKIVDPSATQPKTNDAPAQEQKVPESGEAFAFDSVVILGQAVESCKDHLDRLCVLHFLQRQQILRGRCETYDLHEGERQHAYYYVYAAVYEADRQEPVGAGNQQLIPKWCAKGDDDGLKLYTETCTERGSEGSSK